MKTREFVMTWLVMGCAVAAAQTPTVDLFEKPVRLKGGGSVIAVEAPGYAAPCWFDLNRDGYKDLIVGQFNDGKMSVYHGTADGSLAKGEWIKIGDEAAIVPGVW